MKFNYKHIILILALCVLAPRGIGSPQLTPAVRIQSSVDKPAIRGQSPTSLKLEGEISITKGNPKVSLSLRDSDVTQVLRMFADKAGLNIVFHNSVAGKVTLDLVNVPLNEAFKLVMQITDLTYYIDNNTMVIASAKEAMQMNLSKQEMVSLPVKYVDASTMAEFLNKNIYSINKPGLSNAEIAITNPNMNEVLIFGTQNDVRMAQKIIDKFDVKPLSASYNVNHTTPAEMADLICTMLFPPTNGSSGGDKGGGGNDGGVVTGGASSTGSSSGSSGGSSSSSSSSSSSNSTDSIAIGGGIIACDYANKVNAGKLASFNSKSMQIAYFPQNGTINVSGGSAQQLEAIKEFILRNDRKQPQAYLELSIIELNESGMKQFDNSWQVWSKYFSANFNGTTATNPLYPTFFKGDGYNVVDPEDPTKIKYKIEKFTGTPTVTYAINYLIENKKGRVLANPRIMITNGQTSTIDLTSDYIKTVKSEVMNTGGLAGAVQKTYEIGEDDGMKIELIPFISPDGYVTLNIKPEYATIKEKVFAAGEAKVTDLVATLLQRRNLELKNVRIRDGETLVIGGMIREDEQKTVAKVPILGDIPIIGVAFRNSSTTKSKNELIIMITPKIVKDSEDMPRKENMDL